MMKTVRASLPLAIAEAAWIESESIRLLVAKLVETQLLAFMAMTMMVIMIYGHIPTVQVITWYALNLLLSMCRVWLLKGYRSIETGRNKVARDVFFIRYGYLVPVISFFWATSAYFFYGKVPPVTASFCLLIVGMFGIFSTTYLSNHARLLKRFLIAFALGLTGSVAVQVVFDQHFQIDKEQMWFIMMVALFVLLLNRVGDRMNRTFIKSLKLQHRNKRLIHSLTQQREAALSAVATKNRLLASAAHDMRQPVLALDIYADWLMSEPSASKELSPKISAATKAVIALFDSLFDMAKLAEGQISVNVSRINIKTLMDDLSVQYLPIAQAKQLDLRMRMFKKEGRDCDVDLWTDPLLIKRILGNLISNAIKYTDAGGVLVACRNTLKGIRFEIWDTGVGIAAEQQDLVFREFYKGSTNTGTTDGFGLGLAIVTQLTELLGYELVMKSRVGRGTTMSLQLTIQY
jgi:signal transduction histidine kinase